MSASSQTNNAAAEVNTATTTTTTNVVALNRVAPADASSTTTTTTSQKATKQQPFVKYTPKIECLICYEQLGQSAGFIPVVFVGCVRVAHVACLTCWGKMRALARDGELPLCPLCRTPVADALPITSAVGEDFDLEAAKQLAALRGPMAGTTEALIEKCKTKQMARVAKTDADRQLLLESRVCLILDSIDNALRMGTRAGEFVSVTNWWNEPVSFDKDLKLTYTNRAQRAEVERNIETINAELQAPLDAICLPLPYRILMVPKWLVRQGRKNITTYLAYQVVAATPGVALTKKRRRPSEKSSVHESGDDDDDDDWPVSKLLAKMSAPTSSAPASTNAIRQSAAEGVAK